MRIATATAPVAATAVATAAVGFAAAVRWRWRRGPLLTVKLGVILVRRRRSLLIVDFRVITSLRHCLEGALAHCFLLV